MIEGAGEPSKEILSYVRHKLRMSRAYPRESRLFANEILQGIPRIHSVLSTELKQLVDDKAKVIQAWIDAGRIAPVHPHHLICPIWALTRHYADFDVQVRAVLGDEDPDDGTEEFVATLYSRALTPPSSIPGDLP